MCCRQGLGLRLFAGPHRVQLYINDMPWVLEGPCLGGGEVDGGDASPRVMMRRHVILWQSSSIQVRQTLGDGAWAGEG